LVLQSSCSKTILPTVLQALNSTANDASSWHAACGTRTINANVSYGFHCSPCVMGHNVEFHWWYYQSLSITSGISILIQISVVDDVLVKKMKNEK
jgi:hypothetical protein